MMSSSSDSTAADGHFRSCRSRIENIQKDPYEVYIGEKGFKFQTVDRYTGLSP